MEALLAAIDTRPSLLPLLQEAAALQVCGGCCLRLAAVRDAAAYTSPNLPHSAADVVEQMEARASGSADAGEAVAEEGGEGSKRRRLDAPPAAPACPLCLGLLHPESGTNAASGVSDTAEATTSQTCCPVELLTSSSSLSDPGRHRGLWAGSGAAAAAEPGDASLPAGSGGGQAAADHGAPAVSQHSSAVPSLAAAAAAVAAEFQLDGFALEVSLPASLAVRQQALSWRLRQRDQQQQQQQPDAQQQQQQQQQQQHGLGEALAAAMDVKEAVKLKFTALLAAALGRPHQAQSDLRIALNVTHVDAAAECGWLATGGGKQRRGRHGRHAAQQQQQWRQAETLALTDAVVQRLAALDAAAFSASCPAAAARLSPPATPAVLQLQARRRPLHVGGRYLKLRRGIPQSPWLIDGARKGEGSVQEAIEAAVLPAFQADSYTLVTAGREDIDVRMLGAGRPFILEIHNARRAMPPAEELRLMEAAVEEISHGGVAVRGLHAASPAALAALKEGEQDKEKSYCALCWAPRPLGDAELAALERMGEVEVVQQTPVRVLHRRANMERPRRVLRLRGERLEGQPPGYFALRLRTQAGTYVKEFVHGDLGRSRPSLGDLLGGLRVQCVRLDVLDVHMGFGPD